MITHQLTTTAALMLLGFVFPELASAEKQSPANKNAAKFDMPAYQFPPEPVTFENSKHWQWMTAFYQSEVSRPASSDETLEQAIKRAASVKPSREKLAYLDMELITFPHFGMSTVSGAQQGTGKEDPKRFNPTKFDAREWVRFHKAIGAKMIVFIAKHHDGYALWPSKLNDYNIRSSPWRDGKGDMVKEMAIACREGGLKFGLYISLWDEHDPRCVHPRNSVSAAQMSPEQRQTYQNYIETQLHETLDGRYGEISELWFDGAGTNGAEDWNRIYEIVHRYQPKSLIAMCGFGIRWCGNEGAIGDAVNWNVLPMMPQLSKLEWVPFHYDQLISKNLPKVTANPESLRGQDLFFVPQEGDTRVLNGGWHWDGIGTPFSLESLINIYYASIGSGATLIISPAPDASGAFNPQQTERLVELRRWIDDSFRDNLLRAAKLTLAGARSGYSPANLLREERDQPCVARDETSKLALLAEFPAPKTFNNLVVEEFLVPGQRISTFALDAWQDEKWTTVVEASTIGRKKVLPFSEVTTSKVRFRVLDARDVPALRFIGLYKSLPYQTNKKSYTEADFQKALPERAGLKPGLQWSFYEDANNGFLPYQELFSDLNTTKVKPVASGRDANPMNAFRTAAEGRNRKEHFAMRFDGYFRAPARAIYKFKAGSSTGCRLFINGRPLIENDASAGNNKEAEVPLFAGLHRITLLSYDGTSGKPQLTLEAEWPGIVSESGFGWSPEMRLLPLLLSDESAQPAQ